MKNILIKGLLVSVCVVSMTSSAFAVWWNPVTWFNSNVVNGINVPSIPDKKINNSTLAGIDSNNNGVRDDIERHLAKYAKSKDEFKYILGYAKEYQKQITEPTPKSREEALKIFVKQACVYEEASKNGFKIADSTGAAMDLYVNTSERKKAMNDFNDVLVAFSSSYLTDNPCK